MSNSLKIAIAGLGTVGAGVVKLLRENTDAITARCGKSIEVVAVAARDKKKDRGVDLSKVQWLDDPQQLAKTDADIVVELIGGAEGPAHQLVEAALANKKHVVTANKALVAYQAKKLAALAEKNKVVLAFEAAVAGGIPIIQALRNGLAANQFKRIVGILNGTSNFILTQMQKQGTSFEDALAEAQRLGYAEADPSFDVNGNDTAHKLSILTALAYGCLPDPEHIYVEGIREVTKRDMEFATELGYTIKLLGITSLTPKGIEQRVHPCMVPLDSPIGVDGVYNAIVAEGNAVGRVIFEGRGAGAGPTASSVVADIIDIARGTRYLPFTLPAEKLAQHPATAFDEFRTSYYLRAGVIDRPGVLAEVTGIFRDESISMRSFLQHGHKPGEAVQLVVTTHETQESALKRAVKKIAALDSVVDAPHVIRIEQI